MMGVESPYPNGCRSAVSLTFDDGLRSQLEVAVPMLNDREMLSTFYIPPRGNDPWSGKLEEHDKGGTDGPFHAPTTVCHAISPVSARRIEVFPVLSSSSTLVTAI